MVNKQERHKKRTTRDLWKNNLIFICGCAILSTIIVLGIILQLLMFRKILDFSCGNYQNDVGVFCQIGTALSVCLVSIMGISISIQKEDWFGITIKELNTLRIDKHFSFLQTLLIVLSLLTCCGIAYSLGFYFLSFILCVVAILFVIWVATMEIPYILREDKKILKIIKIYIMNAWCKGGVELEKKVNNVLKRLVANSEKNFNLLITYQCFSDDDKIYNLYLLRHLLDIQVNVANDTDTITDKKELRQTISALEKNIWDIVRFNEDFDISKIIIWNDEEPLYKNAYWVTWVLFGMLKTDAGEKAVLRIIEDTTSMLDFLNIEQEKIDFIVNIILVVTTITVKAGNLKILTTLRKVFSDKIWGIEHEGNLSTLFSIISMHLFYLIEISKEYPEKNKSELKKFIQFSGIVDNYRIVSWCELYTRFSHSFSVGFKNFYRMFCLNEHNWEYELYNEGHWVELTPKFIVEWFLANKLNSFYIKKDDFEEIVSYNEVYKMTFSDIVGEMFARTDSAVCIPEHFRQIVNFFGPKCDNLNVICIRKDISNMLFNMYNGIKKEELENTVIQAREMANDELSKVYKEKIEEKVQSEQFFDKSIIIDSQEITTGLIIEKDYRIINLEDWVVQYFTGAIFHVISSHVQCLKIKKDEEFDKNIDSLLNLNITHSSYDVKNCLEYYIMDENIREKLKNKINNKDIIRSHILPIWLFIINDNFRFNCEITNVEIKPLNSDQLSERVNDFKRADGQYVYQGAFLPREDIENKVKEIFACVYVTIRYKLNYKECDLIKLDMFS